MRRGLVLACLALVVALGGCGSQSQTSSAHARRQRPTTRTTGATRPPARAGRRAAVAIPAGDWPQFNFTAQRTGAGPAHTGITAGDLDKLRLRAIKLPGVADSSAIELHGIRIDGRPREVLVLTTSYGHTLAINAATGQAMWEFTPSDIGSYNGSAQFTTATPTADPDRKYVYATSPDGKVHKLVLATGREVRAGGWPVAVTLDPTHEKLASPPSLDGRDLIVVTDGYDGDVPHYQGHVVSIDRATGRIAAVFNSLCSDRPHLIVPTSCPQTDSAIWGRSGAVIERNGNILVATSNGYSASRVSFNGRSYWSDSVLELSPALKLLHNWTPSDQLHLTEDDLDLGSTSPALLPGDLAVQGGKSGELSLLDLKRLDGTTGPAGPRTGGQLQTIAAPGTTDVFSEPAVWTSKSGTTYVFVTTSAGTAAYRLGSDRRLSVAWQNSTPGTSPVIAGGLLYVYDEIHGALLVRNPVTGHQLRSLPVGPGHWNSPIVIDGRIVLPIGNANSHDSTGTLDIYHLPGR
ncbi:MAG: PQQ-binding-like beta-propeller repeat protein [Solirubrobacteraceae bacterium]